MLQIRSVPLNTMGHELGSAAAQWDELCFFVWTDAECACDDDQVGVVLNACLQDELGEVDTYPGGEDQRAMDDIECPD